MQYNLSLHLHSTQIVYFLPKPVLSSWEHESQETLISSWGNEFNKGKNSKIPMCFLNFPKCPWFFIISYDVLHQPPRKPQECFGVFLFNELCLSFFGWISRQSILWALVWYSLSPLPFPILLAPTVDNISLSSSFQKHINQERLNFKYIGTHSLVTTVLLESQNTPNHSVSHGSVSSFHGKVDDQAFFKDLRTFTANPIINITQSSIHEGK